MIFKVFAYIWLNKGNQYEFLKHSKIKWLDGGLESEIDRILNRLAQLVEQWTGNPKAGVQVPRLTI